MVKGLAQKTMLILETLLENTEEMDLREIAVRTNIPKSTVHRILSSLEKDRWVLQEKETRKYRPGARILIFADSWRVRQSLIQTADIPMRHLVEQTGETTVLAVTDGCEVRCAHVVESSHAVKFSFRVGGKLPIHAGATGKVILAFGNEDIRKTVFSSPLTAFTENTITSMEKLEEEIEIVRQRGYAISIEEVDPGGTAIGAPILSIDGRLLASLILSGPRSKFERKIEDLAPMVVKTARDISALLLGSGDTL